MAEPPARVGLVHDGALSEEQRAALDWLSDGVPTAAAVAFEALDGMAERFDALWWHRAAPLAADGPPGDAAPAVDAFLEAGGGLVLTLRAMGRVDTLGVETTGPDAVGVDSITEPTGVLWRTQYADGPVSDGDGLRLPVCDRGAVPVARYERVLPAAGEVLASTVRGRRDVRREISVVTWDAGPGDGGVIGVGAPLTFAHDLPGELAGARDRLTAGCLAAATASHLPGRPRSADELRRLRAWAAGDPDRPQYHLTPPANWLNDPNGLIRWDGRYHVFYQYNPAGPFHNTIHWGHAVSDDLLHWTDEPVALAPSPDGPDRHGCWSGCAVDDDGTATVVYTGGRDRWQLPCLATAEDPGLIRWRKHDDNPVIEAPPEDLDVLETDHWNAEFRDHSVWRADGRWHQIVGTGLTEAGGAALLYTSEDLRNWRYEGPLLIDDQGSPGTVWECPELLDLGDRQLLHVSEDDTVTYFLGRVRDGRFAVESRGRLDGGDFYAPQSMRDGDRHLTWGWLPEVREPSAQWEAGWSGALSLPRVITTGPDGRLRQRPAAELAGLRNRRYLDDASLALAAGDRRRLGASGRTLELSLEIDLRGADAVELSAFESPDRRERTPIRYTAEGELLVDRERSSEDPRVATGVQRLRVGDPGEPLTLRCFLDGSVIELFANDRHCLTSRVYPTRTDSTGLSVLAEGGPATVQSLSVWSLGTAFDLPGPADAAPEDGGPVSGQ